MRVSLLLHLLLSVSVARSFGTSGPPLSPFRLATALVQKQGGRQNVIPSSPKQQISVGRNFRGGAELESTATSTDSPQGNETDKKGKYSQKFSNLLSKVRAAPFALAAAFLIVGYKLGVNSVSKNVSGTAAKASVGSARSAARQYPLLAVVLLVVAIRDAWSLVPDWAKKNFSIFGKKVSEEDMDQDDLTSFPAMSLKLQKLFQRGKEKLLTTDGEEMGNPVLVFLALIRMVNHMKQQMASKRDKTYAESGTNVDNPKEVLDGMDEYFEYADWAYNEFGEGKSLKDCLAAKGYSLLRHDLTTLPGHVAHYVAVSPERKEALIGIKGTSGFEDMITDCCGDAVCHKFEDGPFVEGGRTEIMCHEGILLTSKRLADDLQTFVDKVLLPTGYTIKVVGHSLGAGVGVLFAVILRSRLQALRVDNGEKLKVLAFASPPILDYQASTNCRSFVDTFVNNGDIIPRCSLSNLFLLMEVMKKVDRRLDEEGLSPKGLASTAKYIKMLARKKQNHEETIMDADEIQENINTALEKTAIDEPDHLYVAGRVIHMYDEWSKEGYGNKSNYEDEEDEAVIVPTVEKVYTADGSAKALRIIEIDERMMEDHMSASYRASLRSLLHNTKPISKNEAESLREKNILM